MRGHFLNGWVEFLFLLKSSWKPLDVYIVISLVLDSFRKQGIAFWFFMSLERLNDLPLNTVTSNFAAIFVFFGTASSFTERISSLQTTAKREAILLFFGSSRLNSMLG